RFPDRRQHLFNRAVLLIKLTPAEMARTARVIASRLNRSKGPVTVVLPQRGISMFDHPGGPFVEPGLNEVLFHELKVNLQPSVHVIELDAHINDPAVASTCIARLLSLFERDRSVSASHQQEAFLGGGHTSRELSPG